jgi:Fe-S oxidoreductase
MCNNNGACRKASRGIMCPSYRVTGDERHVTRGRANSLRLALSGQLGADALGSDAMAEAMSLCLSCKGCKGECPTGVDMAKLKIEVLARHQKRLRDRLIAYLPRYAPWASRFRWLANLRNRSDLLRHLGERIGFSVHRDLPEWHARPFLETPRAEREGPEVALFADTFNTWFEPKVPRAALVVLNAAGCRVTVVRAPTGRPLCCGRTALAVGDIAVARKEIERSLAVLAPLAQRGVPILGLEPSCLYTLRDEWPALLPGPKTDAVAARAQLFESYLVETDVVLPFAEQSETRVMVHGHCHQKVFAAAGDTTEMLSRVPGLMAEPIESTCCGMAGAFGYQTETYETSMAVGALDLFPALNVAPADALVVADGTSCRCQIADGARRQAEHAAVVLAQALSQA